MNHLAGNIKKLIILLFGVAFFAACDQFEEDVMPITFGGDLRVNPDVLYLYNNKTSRLHSAANDTIISFDKITYSAPKNGVLVPNFDGVEGTMGYRPNPGFVGTDSLTYQVCSGQTCKSAKIKFFVREPLDPMNCTTTVAPDFVTTKAGKPKEIRIYLNDRICAFGNISTSLGQPSNGTLGHYSYYEGYDNDVLIYTPDKGFKGTDSFKYKVYPRGYNGNNPNEYLEAEVRITVE